MHNQIGIVGSNLSSRMVGLMAASNVWTLVNNHDFDGATDRLAEQCGIRRKRPKATRRCALPGCTETTTHNSGYCCAEHNRAHQTAQPVRGRSKQTRAMRKAGRLQPTPNPGPNT